MSLRSTEFENSASAKIIVALDYPDLSQALTVVRKLKSDVGCFKVGMELLNSAGLPQVIEAIKAEGVAVFADIKAKDIPNTVAGAVAAAARAGADIINVHATGGVEMMKRANCAAKAVNPDAAVIAVTILTSLSDADVAEIGYLDSAEMCVYRLANLAKKAGLDGIVCSPQELLQVRAIMGEESLIITPGIRPAWSEKNDQKRFTTPAEAIVKGTSMMVIGRPITAHENPAEAVALISKEIDDALKLPREKFVPKSKLDYVIDKLFEYGLVKFGKFTLKSGAISPVYMDVRNVVNYHDLHDTVVDLYEELVVNNNQQSQVKHIAGIPFGALYIARDLQKRLGKGIVTVRPEKKEHGTKGQLIGVYSEGDTVLVIEDVATTGGSTLEAVEKLRAEGLKVSDAIVLIDRQESAEKNLLAAGIHLHSVVNLTQIISRLSIAGKITPLQKAQVEVFMRGENWEETAL